MAGATEEPSRAVLITGASRGIGRATIHRLSASGYAVVVNYLHDQRAAESAVEAILAGNTDAVAVRADVADELDVERLFAETIAAFGGIDVVVHAAGRRITASAVAEAGLDEFDALVRINTRAAFVVSREAARHLRNGGAIVNLSSNITVNAVSLDVRGPCAPNQVADVIAYLLSDHGRGLTGQVLRVGDPGLRLAPGPRP